MYFVISWDRGGGGGGCGSQVSPLFYETPAVVFSEVKLVGALKKHVLCKSVSQKVFVADFLPQHRSCHSVIATLSLFRNPQSEAVSRYRWRTEGRRSVLLFEGSCSPFCDCVASFLHL